MDEISKEIIINGFPYDPESGYLGIYNGYTSDQLELTERVIERVLNTIIEHGIRKLYFGSPFLKSEDISFIENVPFLTGVRIGLDGFDISPLAQCKNLEEISIPFSYKGMIDFSDFTILKELSINWRNKGTETVFDCANLKDLYIFNYSGTSLLDFCKLQKLESLTLTDPKILSLAGIDQLKKLKKLEIIGARKLVNIDHIEECQMLNEIFIHGCKKIESLEPLMYLKNLKWLNLASLGKIATIKFLAPLKQLEEFYMEDSTNVVDGDLRVLQELREKGSLKKVNFINRKHYSHTREQLGYKLPESVAALLKKKK